MNPPADDFQRAVDSDNVPSIIQALKALDTEACAERLAAIIPLLDHKSFAVREAALRVVGDLSAPGALPKILERADRRQEKDRHVRRQAILSLSSFRGPEVERALRFALGDPALNVREDAQRVLDAVTAEG